MTRLQFDNACNKMHDVLDAQGCVCIKATMNSANFDRFMDGCVDLRSGIDYHYSCMGNDTVYVYVLVLNDSDYDKHEYAGFVASELEYYGAKKIESL